MIQLVVAIVTAAAGILTAFLTARGLPTLDRRVKDHAALLKELPDDLATGVKSLLADELSALVTRDRRRIGSARVTAIRVTTFFVILLSALLAVVFLGEPSPTDPDAPTYVALTGLVLLIALAAAAVVMLGLSIWSGIELFEQGRRAPGARPENDRSAGMSQPRKSERQPQEPSSP